MTRYVENMKEYVKRNNRKEKILAYTSISYSYFFHNYFT